MPHFFINSSSVETHAEKNKTENRKITITDKDLYRHLVKSRRSKINEKILLIDENEIQYEAVIVEIKPNELVLEVKTSYLSNRRCEFELVLAQSPLRSDAQSMIIEKSTELGVSEIYPIITDNCSVSKSIAEKKVERWQKIMYESSKQCERANIPKCNTVSDIETVLSKKFDKVIAFCERNTETTLKGYLSKNPIKRGDRILIIIGPEGGFSTHEFELFTKNGIPTVTLGPLILKAETAVIVALGDIIYEYSK